ncbi:MAG: Bax inhibitor-1/YccA family protein [Betaproteobacteria bacterium]|jgi:modulator of FtsH protease|nr:Bax inhibitor-1/YccA family protein [Betaproteobacteria bacterium]
MVPTFGNSTSLPGAESSAVRNRVLRNTYWLLAASLVPTVLGAWVGMQLGFSWFAGSPLIGVLLFLGIAFGFFYAIEKTKNSVVGVYLLLGFTFFMGLMLSRLIGIAVGLSNGVQLIGVAGAGTAAVFFGMASIASTTKRDLSNMGKFLMIGVILLIVASIANIWLQMPALMLTISALAVAIFSLFLLYDINRIVTGGETNYISATLAVYLSVYNIFSNLLVLLMSLFGGNRD